MSDNLTEGISVDFSHAPICVLRYSPQIKPEHYSKMFEEIRAGRIDGQQYALLIDVRLFNPLSASTAARNEASRLTIEDREQHKDQFVCEARLIHQGLARAVVTVYDWTTPLPWPRKNFSTPRVAEHWVRTRLQLAKVDPPSSLLWP